MISLVLHFDYQQIGRVSRDGKKGHAVLFYRTADIKLNTGIICGKKYRKEQEETGLFDNRTNLTEVIRLFYHADVENFTMDKYNNYDENAHSFTIKRGPITFTAYDKNYEVKHNKKLGNEYDEKILRIEIKVERDGFKSSFNLDKEVQEYNFDELLHRAYKSRKEILNRYLTKLFPGTGQHLPYQKAVAKIKTEANEKYREAMVLLLEKTSRLKTIQEQKEKLRRY